MEYCATCYNQQEQRQKELDKERYEQERENAFLDYLDEEEDFFGHEIYGHEIARPRWAV